MNCECGNAARYIDEYGKLVCGICPIRAGNDSIKIADVPKLLAWARQFLKTDTSAALRDIIGRQPPKPAKPCDVQQPPGWRCTRYKHPVGTPCAAVPVDEDVAKAFQEHLREAAEALRDTPKPTWRRGCGGHKGAVD